MAETISITRARIMDRNIMGIVAPNSTTKSGLPRADMSKISAALRFVSTSNKAQDGRLYNLRALVENVRRIRDRGSVTVPWWTYNKYSGQTSNIVEADAFSPSDHINVLRGWRRLGVNRFILWGDPGKSAWETDFGPAIDFVLPHLTPPRVNSGASRMIFRRMNRGQAWWR